MEIFKTAISRRRFLQTTGVAGAAGVVGVSQNGLSTLSEAQAQAGGGDYTVTKNICGQCPARCGIDVYTSNGKVHAIYGNTDHPIANGKLCPKGPLGPYVLYDPDRFKGPMKRTNPQKGRDQDPKFVPISWDEALTTVANRLQALRDKGESHKFLLGFGRGWGASEVGTMFEFAGVYGSQNIGIGHSSMCSDGSTRAKAFTDGNNSYSSYDYANSNYLLMFGAAYLEAFRPYNNNIQQWGYMRGEKTPKTRITVVDVRTSPTAAAADRALLLKPGTDGALALAIAHHMLVNGNWEKSFVGDFKDGVNQFKAGQTLDAASFNEKWVKGLIEWWNIELKDRTPAWAAGVTTLDERDIVATAHEFGTTRPAIALFERGAHTHSNGIPTGMAIHSLNALSGSFYAKGGLAYQMGPSYGPMPADKSQFQDDYAKDGPWKKLPRIDMQGHEDGYKMAKNMFQEVARNHLKGKPYKIDTAMFYMTNPVFSSPETAEWEAFLKEVFVIGTSPFPDETAIMADIVLPDSTYLERLMDAPTYPFQGFPMAQLRVPVVKTLYDTKSFGDIVIELGKKMKGPIGEFHKAMGSQENVVRHLAKGFEKDPGDNGVNSFETWKEKGVWYKKGYPWRQRDGEFYKKGVLMTAADVKAEILKTESGKFEFRSSYLEHEADYVAKVTGRSKDKLMFPHWEAPKYTGAGDLHFIAPKMAGHAEGRGGNIPQAIALLQPASGGRKASHAEIHPTTAKAKGINNGDKIRIKSDKGSIEAIAKVTELVRPDVVMLPFEHGHWGQGRWAKDKARNTQHVDSIITNQSDRISGMANYYTGLVSIERA